ncbi:MAG: 4Fe-4S binding protein [Syntrophales bacterium]|nr:4Fe-4S binding protein [Syntrophales bacterium]
MLDQVKQIHPHVFTSPAELDALVLEPKWLFAKMARSVLRAKPAEFRLAVAVRGCDERAVVELVKRSQIDRERLLTIGYACGAEQAKACLCSRPYPEKLEAGEAVAGVDPFADGRCIKCYGCRNSCPICVCVPCKLEDDVWVERGVIPAEMVSFHLIRAFHLSDTCVACGACQEACPVGIPLMTLQLSMRAALKKDYNYEAGLDADRRSPVLFDFIKEPRPGQNVPDWVDSTGKKP